jgi:hypothetical protein
MVCIVDLAGIRYPELGPSPQSPSESVFWDILGSKDGRDPWKLQSLMGHRDLRATVVYVKRLSLEEKKQLLDKS